VTGAVFNETEADGRHWLEANCRTTPELLVGFWKKGTGKPSMAKLIEGSAAGRNIASYDIGRKK
jgi:hypothetical protein